MRDAGSASPPKPAVPEALIMAQALVVEVWSDLICPWCWIGKRRLERALAAFAQREHVTVVHRAYRLMPGLTPRPAREIFAQRLRSAQQIAATLAHVENEAAGEGLQYHLAETFVGDTLDLHRLVKFATPEGLQNKAIERFYRANFSERAPLFDREIQLQLMTEVGLERGACAQVLDGSAYAAVVDEDQRTVQAHGGSGVPFFLIDGRLAVSGAQQPIELLAALQRAWHSREREVMATSTAGGCGSDGCVPPQAPAN